MAAQLELTTDQIGAASFSLAETANKQSGSLEMTCVSSEQIRSLSQENRVEIQAAASATAETAGQVEAANRMLRQTIAAMAAIDTSAHKISKIAQMIDGIAFQTNLLR